MKKAFLIIIFYQLISVSAYSQSDQQKAQELVAAYLNSKPSNQNTSFNSLEVLRSSFSNTKTYKNYIHKIDSLKLEARKIDASFAKLKTTAEINQSKKDSKHLSDQLLSTSSQMIDFMTSYKGQQTGWVIKMADRNKSTITKRFYLNKELTKIDSVR